MTTEKLKQLFALAEELYIEEQNRSGMIAPIPYAYASNYDTRLAIFVSAWGVWSDRAKDAINKMAVNEV